MWPVSTRFLETVAGSHQSVARARLLTTVPQFGPDPDGEELPILGGDVRLSATADVKATASLTIPGDYWDIVQPFGVEVFLERGVAFGDGTAEYAPLGYFRVDEVGQDSKPHGPLQLTLPDRTVQLKQNRTVYPLQVPAGSTHRWLLDRLVNGRAVATDAPSSQGYAMYIHTAVPIVWDNAGYNPDTATVSSSALTVDGDVYEFLAKLLDSRDAIAKFLPTGELAIVRRDPLPDSPALYTLREGATGTLVRVSRSVTRDGVYNIVRASSSDPAANVGYRLAYIADERNPLRFSGPFGAAPRYYASPLLQTTAAADEAAETLLARTTGLPVETQLWTVPNPAMQPLDVVDVVQLGQVVARHTLDEVTVPLLTAGEVEIRTRTLNAVAPEVTPGPEPEPLPDPDPDPGPGPAPGPDPEIVGKRIAYSCDGNQHDDDDWASSAMLFAILAHEGLQANLVHFDYNNHIWDSNSSGPGQMSTSVNGAVQRFGFDPANVFDDLTQLSASVANLTAEINASTADDPLWLSLAGPMETAWQAVNAANPSARAHVKCISHGDWNETHAGTHGGHNYNDIIALGCQRVEITDQNARMGPTDISFWNFLRDSMNPNYQWLYTRFQPATQSRGDVSDIGMVWYTLFGTQTGTRTDIKNLLLATPPSQTPSQDGTQAAVLLGWGSVIDGDEFAYTGAPGGKWSMYNGPGHAGNGLRRPSAFSVHDGMCTITGDAAGTSGGMAFRRDEYGYRVEVRSRTYSINPNGGGRLYHPVWILWPQSNQWPEGAEYDWFETDCDSGKFGLFMHLPNHTPYRQDHYEESLDIQNWHNYACEWNPRARTLKTWIDGRLVYNGQGRVAEAPGPMHVTFQLDNFFGNNMKPARFDAQWVRIYARPNP